MTDNTLPPARLTISGTAGTFTAPINPSELSSSLDISYAESKPGDKLPVGIGRIGNETLTFSLVLDDTGALPAVDGRPDEGIAQPVALLKRILGLTPGSEDDSGGARVQVTWAASTWPCQVSNMAVDYTLFAPSGLPLRAKLQLTFAMCRGQPVPAPAPPPEAEEEEEDPFANLQNPFEDDTSADEPLDDLQNLFGDDESETQGDDADASGSGDDGENNAGLPLKIQIKSGGGDVWKRHALQSLRIHHAVNAIPSAVLEFIDGDIDAGTLPSSDGEHFKPGATIEIKAGYGDAEPRTLFKGLVIKHAVRMEGAGNPRLVIECRHKAVRMTIGRKNANYLAQTDDAIIQALVSAASLTAEVDTTTVTHDELVQHYCSNWDFMLARAEANGLLVIVGDKLVVKAPVAEGEAALTVRYGEDLIEFEAEIDARTQYTAAQAVAWDPKTQQAVLGEEAAPAGPAGQGDLTSATLADVIKLGPMLVRSGAPLAKEALTAWAKALQLKAGLARVRGRMRVQGNAALVPGALVQLEKMGKRFSGKVYASGVRHELVDGDWTTDVEFGLSPEWFVERADVRAPAAAGLLPAIEGLQIGTVLKLDGDPANEHRIQVSVPVLQAEKAGVWARLMQFHGSKGIGSFFVPEIGDEVVLGYFGNDPSHPVVLGSLYSSTRPPPYELAATNDTKAIVTRCKSKIEFDEANKVITVTTPGANKIVISDTDKSILLQDQNDNKLTLGPAGITLDSPKDIQLTAKGRIVLDATGAASIASKADVKLEAAINLACEAKCAFSAKGLTAELAASANAVVKGAMVLIN
ncbi:type VI secretion system tip protein VgrG [Rhizobacter sp. P5_C2]